VSAYTNAVAEGLKGLQAVSTGPCPGCPECADQTGYGEDLEAHRKAWRTGEIESSAGFSWRACQICGCTLGGDREVWHAIHGEPGENLAGREIEHWDSVCTDCIMYLANGEEPEVWRRR
jgi:hypothetical protein